MSSDDIGSIINYWTTADVEFLKGMGVDLNKLPSEEQWRDMLSEQLSQSYEQKKSYCIIWLIDGKPVGHSNVNKIIFGEEAYMHLHLWESVNRKSGSGAELVKLSLPFFFTNLKLKTLYCEPYALNPAPNNTLKKVGFSFIEEHITTPGFLNFEQAVKRWELTLENFQKMK
ncbi:hypothetical protein D3C78_1359300 [compost metagenome]